MTARDVELIELNVTAGDAWIPAANTLKTVTSDDGTLDALADVASAYGTYGSLASALQASGSGAVINENGTHGRAYWMNGGHSNWDANLVAEYDIGTRQWSRAYGPYATLTDALDTYDQFPDGSPAVPHTYDHLVAVPPFGGYTEGALVLAGRAFAGSIGDQSTAYAAILNIATGTWARSTNAPAGMGDAITSAIYYPIDGTVIRFGNAGATSKFCVLDMATRTWGAVQDVLDDAYRYVNGEIVSGWCPQHSVVVQRNTYTGYNELLVFDPVTRQRVAVTTSGSGPARTDRTGIEWCNSKAKFYCYKAGSSSVWTLTPPLADPLTGTWTWATVTFSGASDAPSYTAVSPSSDELVSNIRSNRFRYVERIDAFIWHDTSTAPAQLYKP